MRVEFEKPLFNKDDMWIGTEPAFGTILHWGVSTDERNRGDGVTIPCVYTVVFISEDSTGKVFEISPSVIKTIS
jgi:hypothetical protein